MGQFWSTQPETTADAPVQQPEVTHKFTISARQKIDIILSSWTKKIVIDPVPRAIQKIIIDLYLYQERFEQQPNYKSMPNQYDILFKVILIGNYGVGKTSFIRRWEQGKFDRHYTDEMRFIFSSKKVKYKHKCIKIQIWDTCSMEKYRAITKSFYRDTTGIILCYDITDKQSLVDIKKWAKQCDMYATDELLRVLVGLKSDLDHDRECDALDVSNMANELGIEHFEASSKDDINVKVVMDFVTENIVDYIQRRENYPFCD